MIDSFRGKYYFLSNFSEEWFNWKGYRFFSVEAAFQGEKTGKEETLRKFQYFAPGAAKRAGRIVKLRSDWEEIKLGIMHDLVYEKFSQNPDIKEKLLATGDEELVEGNSWGDCF